MKKILVIGAHLDDIEIGLGGMLAKWKKDEDTEVNCYVLCDGRTEKDSTQRLIASNNNMSEYVDIFNCAGYKDLVLHEHSKKVTECIDTIISEYDPDYVYSTADSDLHQDHKVVAQAVKISCRPFRKNIKGLYQYYIPFSSSEQDNFNIVFDISDFMYNKLKMMEEYLTENIDTPAIMRKSESDGDFFQMTYAEKVKVIFEKR